MNIRKHLGRLHVLVLYGLAFGAFRCGFSAQAAVINVGVTNYTYLPDPITINVNDTIQWNWITVFHSTTSDTVGLWESGVHNPPFSYSVMFTNAGTFPYNCSVHVVRQNMRGTVTVQAGANVSPTVTITNPPDGAVLSAPATITLAATAADSGGRAQNRT